MRCPCGTRIDTPGQTRCWRHRYRVHVDPVTAAVAAAVRARDGGCVGPRVGIPGLCSGPLEMDHLDSGGLGLRGPSSPANITTLCRWHHRWKTEHARMARDLLRTFLLAPDPERR